MSIFSVEWVSGIGVGFAVGITIGLAFSNAKYHKLKALIKTEKIKVTDLKGDEISADQLISILKK